MKTVAFFLTMCLITIKILGQRGILIYPEVGKTMPDITIKNIRYFHKKEASLGDFKGKWLLLDFWNIHCSACIASFPMTNEIQNKLQDKIQVMLVGVQDPGGAIEPMYAKYKERQHLEIPCAFDSVLTNRLDIYIAPHSILIDDKGVVQCITSSFNLIDIQGFLAGKPPILPKSYRRMDDNDTSSNTRYKFNPQNIFLDNNNGGADSVFLFRSILSSWNYDINEQYAPERIDDMINGGKFQVLGAPMEWLFNYAYFGYRTWISLDTAMYGRHYPHPILECKDSSLFKYSYKYSKNLFSYSIYMPKSICTREILMEKMQNDLASYFGFKAIKENRNCPCLKLIANKDAKEKLKSKSKIAYGRNIVFHVNWESYNLPFKQFVRWIQSNLQDIVIDDTGISGNIDIKMDCIPTDVEDLRRALRIYGLDLILSEKIMDVVVILDKS